jgi:predicted transcriptional regulator of viral defense system
MNKHISYRSAELLKALNKLGKSFFTIKDAKEILPKSEDSAVRKLISEMTKRGLILRIKDGLFNLIPYEEDSKLYFPNWHLTAKQLVKPENYYIGFYSALDIHELITQPSLVEQIVTQKQFHPKTKIINKVKFEFITFSSKRFFGFKKTWINDYDKVYCSDIEKTIIDSLYKPNYAAGITEITKAIFSARNKIDQNKMLKYLTQFDTQAVNKRLGFILSNMKLFNSLCEDISNNISNSYTLLDPSLAKKGTYIAKWKIIDNVDIQTVIQSIKT